MIEKVRAGLHAEERALVSVDVELHDESGANIHSATVEWFITERSA